MVHFMVQMGRNSVIYFSVNDTDSGSIEIRGATVVKKVLNIFMHM